MRVVRDVRAERGSLIGIHTALTHATGSAIVVAWDMPFLSVDLMRHMLNLSLAAPAVIPFGPRGLEPFCAVYHRSMLPGVTAMIDRGEFRVRDLMSRAPFTLPESQVALFGDPSRLFFNVNTPEDLARAEVMAREE